MSFAKTISLEINKSIILVKKCMVKRNREGSYSADEPRSRGLPAGLLDRPFYGRVTMNQCGVLNQNSKAALTRACPEGY